MEHLNPRTMERAQRHLLAKAIAEFAHERLLRPELGHGYWSVEGPAGTTYLFHARRHELEHWTIDPASLQVWAADETRRPVDVQAFVTEFAEVLGIPSGLLPVYLEELASTLAGAAWKLAHSNRPAEELAGASYQEIEAAMTEGHPGFVANNGRIGWGARDYLAYAPETGAQVRLVWAGVRRTAAHLSLGAGLTEDELYDGELGADRGRFEAVLREQGCEPADYLLMPLHPWQWENKAQITFAPDLARRDIVLLGEGSDDLQAQQSIRTFHNSSDPRRHYVKTALSIQNMGFMRGLSPAYMRGTPAINDWVHALVEEDRTLRDCGFSVLRERAAVGYTGDAYHALSSGNAHQKMLAALWRESARPAPGERLATMAALLHRDVDGRSWAAAVIARSGRSAEEWLRAYLRAYLRPLVHCLLKYDLAFMPHGENLILVLRDDVPVRVLMKDIGEEICVMGDLELPREVARVRAAVPQEQRALAIHTDVFDGVFRHLGAILDEEGVLDEGRFWDLVAECIAEHEREHPELAEAARTYDLFAEVFSHSCLNRLQLRNTTQMLDLTDQAGGLQFAGVLRNPVARSMAGSRDLARLR